MSNTAASFRRKLSILVVVLMVSVSVFALFPWLSQGLTNALLFFPGDAQTRRPDLYQIDHEEIALTSSDGVNTFGWWMPYQGPPEKDLGVVVLAFHGNAGTVSDRLDFHRALLSQGASVFAIEYRGYGGCDGTPSEEGFALDAKAALIAARKLAKGRKVVVHGRSLGGAVAISLAAHHPVDGVIAESTFTSLKEMAASTGIPFATSLVAYRFESEASISKVEAPVMVIHGKRDELIPFAMGERLAAAAESGGVPVARFPVPGGTHNDTWIMAGESYGVRIAAWLKGLP